MSELILPDGSVKYENGGYSVTVGPDGAIVVKPGDSLSKYSMAIHGNFDALNEYKHRRHRPNGPITFDELQDIPNINLINAGETLYHAPTMRLGSSPLPLPPPPGTGPGPSISADDIWDRILKLLHYISRGSGSGDHIAQPRQPPKPPHNWVSDWRVTSSAGYTIGIDTEIIKIGFSRSQIFFWVQRPYDPAPTVMTGRTLGVSVGMDFEGGSPIGGSFSLANFPSKGMILKGPKSGATLSKDELKTTGFIAVEGNVGGGLSGSVIVIIAHDGPPDFYIQWLNPIYHNAANLAPVVKWIIVNTGLNISTPDVSTTLHYGNMTVS
ncbi:MAG: hypothetical protein KDB79_03720 [Acidobacteria bacterium]|nr:hypothetical protein [Acidobacteriota bacterium]